MGRNPKKVVPPKGKNSAHTAISLPPELLEWGKAYAKSLDYPFATWVQRLIKAEKARVEAEGMDREPEREEKKKGAEVLPPKVDLEELSSKKPEEKETESPPGPKRGGKSDLSKNKGQ